MKLSQFYNSELFSLLVGNIERPEEEFEVKGISLQVEQFEFGYNDEHTMYFIGFNYIYQDSFQINS